MEFLTGELGNSKSEQGHRAEIRGGTEEEIHKSRDISPHPTDEIHRNLRGMGIL